MAVSGVTGAARIYGAFLKEFKLCNSSSLAHTHKDLFSAHIAGEVMNIFKYDWI